MFAFLCVIYIQFTVIAYSFDTDFIGNNNKEINVVDGGMY